MLGIRVGVSLFVFCLATENDNNSFAIYPLAEYFVSIDK